MIDELLLLCQGRNMYSGRVIDVPSAFASCGAPIPPHWNPADWIIEVSEENETSEALTASRDNSSKYDNQNNCQQQNLDSNHDGDTTLGDINESLIRRVAGQVYSYNGNQWNYGFDIHFGSGP